MFYVPHQEREYSLRCFDRRSGSFDGTPQKAALGIHIILPDLHAGQRGFAVGGKLTGLRYGKTDRDWLRRRAQGSPTY